MDDHKRALFEAWWSYGVKNPDLLGVKGRTPLRYLIGGAESARRVVAFLKTEKKLALIELESSFERERGREWWAEFFEKPADDELRMTLRMAVHRRASETPEDYEARLTKVAAALRARLPDYIREPKASEEA